MYGVLTDNINNVDTINMYFNTEQGTAHVGNKAMTGWFWIPHRAYLIKTCKINRSTEQDYGSYQLKTKKIYTSAALVSIRTI